MRVQTGFRSAVVAALAVGLRLAASAYDDALPWRYDTSGRDGDVVDRESAVSSAEIASLPVDWSLSMPASYLFGLFDSRSGDEDESLPQSVNFLTPATILFIR